MNWIPLYITGRDGFNKIIHRSFDHAGINYLPGYLVDELQTRDHQLYWIENSQEIREVKQAIGAKRILKYRLRFSTELEDFLQWHDDKTSKTFEDMHVNADY